MKRSEMIEIMIDAYLKYSTKMSTTRDKMNHVLDDIEKAGMSPPDYDNTVYGWNEGFISPPEWEPENE
jgi:hypothetical protein